MERKELSKFVYEDDGITKVVKGVILSEDEYTYTLEAANSQERIILGKRCLVKVTRCEV